MAATMGPHKCLWHLARPLPLRAMDVVIAPGKPAAARACVSAWQCTPKLVGSARAHESDEVAAAGHISSRAWAVE